jgi:hypothetical protein
MCFKIYLIRTVVLARPPNIIKSKLGLGRIKGIKIGDIDVAKEITELHYQLLRAQLVLGSL